MFVEDSEETRVKTENAIRKVPVHPQLIELGFLDYVVTLKKTEERKSVLGIERRKRWVCK